MQLYPLSPNKRDFTKFQTNEAWRIALFLWQFFMLHSKKEYVLRATQYLTDTQGRGTLDAVHPAQTVNGYVIQA